MLEPRNVFRVDRSRVRQEEAALVVEWTVPGDAPYFEGHFPGNPVFPAVALIDGSCEFLRELAGQSGDPVAIKVAKFMGVVTPGMPMTIHLSPVGPKEWNARWATKKDDGTNAVMTELTILF